MPFVDNADKGSSLTKTEADNIVKELGTAAQTIASAATVDLTSVTGNVVLVSGTVTITSFGSVSTGPPQQRVAPRIVRFSGILILTNNANIILPTGANITTQAGDVAIFFWDGAAWRCSSYLRADGTALTVTAVVFPKPNIVPDGSCQVAQGPNTNGGTAIALTTGALYGAVDMWACWVSTGAVSAGTITQDLASPIGRKGTALKVAGATITGAGVLSHRIRISSREALRLKNATVSFGASAYQDTGGAINYTTIVRKPTAVDNYAGVTVIGTSSATSVPSAASTPITFPNLAIGDCSFGIEIEVQAACGAVTTKNFSMSEVQIHEGTAVQTFQYDSFETALLSVMPYVQKSFPYATAPLQNGGVVGALQFSQVPGAASGYLPMCLLFPVRMIKTPAITWFNPSAANAQVRNTGASSDWTATTTGSALSDSTLVLSAATPVGSAAQQAAAVHWFADARL